MKITCLMLLLSVSSIFAGHVKSQVAKVSITAKNASINTVLKEIEQQTNYLFVYNKREIDLDRKIDVTIENQSVAELLSGIFKNTNVVYAKEGDNIMLIYKDISHQQLTIKGKVTDKDGSPLPGVNVVEKGTTNGAVTDLDGKYSISVASQNAVMSFSYVGFLTEDIEVGDQTTIDVVLVEDILTLDEVVVIGYGTSRKSDLTGAITTVSTKDFEKIPASNPVLMLQGRAAGVQITTSSGLPDAGANVLIRGVQSINGTSSPVYVIDGVIKNNMDNINPNSIESISVLKDASAAAIYGARAANGVILVTTKRGAGKRDLEISLDAYYGLQNESNLKLNLLNADQFLDLWTEAYENAGIDIPWDNETLSHYTGVNTNWKDLMIQTGVIQNYDLSVQGGSEKSNYFVSANFLDNKGMVINTNYDKYTLTFNTDHKITKWIKFGNSLVLSSRTTEGTASKSGLSTLDVAPYIIGLSKTPLTRAYEGDGDYGYIFDSELEHLFPNPIWMAREIGNEVRKSVVQGSLYVTLNLMEGLEFTTRGSIDYGTRYRSYFSPGIPLHYGWEGTNVNKVENTYTETKHWMGDFLLNYTKTINEDHDLKVLLGYSLEESSIELLSGSRTNTPNNEIRYFHAGDPDTQINDNTFSDWAFASIFGRLNYTYKNKYLLTATVRRDGTSRLIGDNKYGVFPSASAAWRMSEEGFLSGVDFIDDLKLRVSYGTLGNILSITEYATTASLSLRNTVLDNKAVQGYTLFDATNSDLKWEEARKKNLGVDAALLNNRLYTNIDFFIEDTYDQLFRDPIPYSSGLGGNPLINAGQVRNTGYEFVAGYRNTKSDWSYDVSFNFSHVKNEVVDLEGRDLRTSGLVEGYPIRSYFGYKSDGIIYNESELAIYEEGAFATKDIGDIKLLDVDGYNEEGELTGIPDGKIDAADRTIIGKRYPDFIYGALGTVSYKNWSFQMQLQGVQGVDLNYGSSQLVQLMSSFARNEDARILNRYHPTKNPNGTWPRVSKSDEGKNLTDFSDFWLEDASYMRIKNVNLNYSLPKDYCSKLGMRELGVYISIQNAYTFTKYGGPEVDITADPLTGVPQPRIWTLGLKAIF